MARWNLDNNSKNQTNGMVESQREMGTDARNLGLRSGDETAKKEPIQTMYTPIAETAQEIRANRVPEVKAASPNLKFTQIKKFMIGICRMLGILVKSQITRK